MTGTTVSERGYCDAINLECVAAQHMALVMDWRIKKRQEQVTPNIVCVVNNESMNGGARMPTRKKLLHGDKADNVGGLMR